MEGKGENACNQHFLHFPQCFLKVSFFKVVKSLDFVVKSIPIIWTTLIMLFFFWSAKLIPKKWIAINPLDQQVIYSQLSRYVHTIITWKQSLRAQLSHLLNPVKQTQVLTILDFWKHCRKGRKILVNSFSSFSHNVLYLFWHMFFPALNLQPRFGSFGTYRAQN